MQQSVREPAPPSGDSLDAPEPESPADLRRDYGALYAREFPRVYNYLRYRTGSADLADELTAQTFTKALQNLGSFDARRGSPTTWLLAIARNCIRDHLRRSRRWRGVSLDRLLRSRSEGPDPEEALEARERRQRVLAALARLDDRERDILGLKFAGQRSNKDIARLTRLKESHVAVLVYRAVRKLRSELTEYEANRA